MSTDREQKLKIIDDAINSIERTYGKGSIMKLGEARNPGCLSDRK